MENNLMAARPWKSTFQREATMATLIIAAAIVGFVLLLTATVGLVSLNWSERIYAPALSILLVGIATVLAAVVVTLKSTTIESAFTTSVVLDSNEGVPPLLGLDPDNLRLTSRLQELSSLGQPGINVDGKTVITIQKPTPEN